MDSDKAFYLAHRDYSCSMHSQAGALGTSQKFYDFVIGPYSKKGITVFQVKEKDKWFLIVNGIKTDLDLKGFLKNTPVEITERMEVKALGLNKNREIVLVTVNQI